VSVKTVISHLDNEKLTSTRIDSGSSVSDISVALSKISLEENKVVLTQESRKEKNNGEHVKHTFSISSPLKEHKEDSKGV